MMPRRKHGALYPRPARQTAAGVSRDGIAAMDRRKMGCALSREVALAVHPRSAFRGRVNERAMFRPASRCRMPGFNQVCRCAPDVMIMRHVKGSCRERCCSQKSDTSDQKIH